MSRVARGRLAPWAAFAALLMVAPLVFTKGFALTLLCQMGIVMIFALSYNMLLGQTGLLSFGHAVYYGLGAIITIHALNLGHGKLPVVLMPLIAVDLLTILAAWMLRAFMSEPVIEGEEPANLRLAQFITTAIDSDSVEIGREGRITTKPIERKINLDEDLLDNILDIASGSYHRDDEP